VELKVAGVRGRAAAAAGGGGGGGHGGEEFAAGEGMRSVAEV